MAEIQEKDKGGKKKGQQKKMKVHVDFTPMVDMNMLLICFFMLATSMSKPQTMEISMPTNDKELTEDEKTKVQASRAITILLGGDNEIYYYQGEIDYENPDLLVKTNYTPAGLRAFLLNRNLEVVNKIEELKQKKLNQKFSEEEYDAQSSEIKQAKSAPVVIIKPGDSSNYENLIDALDEMHICSISKYAIVDITNEDEFLIENYKKARGESSAPSEKIIN